MHYSRGRMLHAVLLCPLYYITVPNREVLQHHLTVMVYSYYTKYFYNYCIQQSVWDAYICTPVSE